MRNKIYLLLLLVIGLFQTKAEEIAFINLSTGKGLTNNTINCIHKDGMGFLWLGTANGLNRFDGLNILSFDDFKDQLIVAIMEADSANLYVLSEKTLNKYNRRLRKNTRFDLPAQSSILSNNLAGSRNGDVYIISDKGLLLLSKQATAVASVDLPLLKGKTLTGILIDDDDVCWMTSTEGLIRYDLSTQEIQIYDFPDNKHLLGLAKERSTLYVGSQQGKILTFDTEDATSRLINVPDIHYIQTMYCHQGLLYIGTNGNGLKIIDPKRKETKTIAHKPGVENGLSSNAIYSLLVDDDSFWVGTFSGGLNYTISSRKTFQVLNDKNVFDTFNKNIRSFYVDGNGRGIYGTRNGFIFQSAGNWKQYDTDNTPELSSNIILKIYPYQGNFLLGTYGGGLSLFDTSTLTIKRFHDAPLFSSGSFYSILEGQEGDIWFGTLAGLIHYHSSNHTYTLYDTSNSGLLSNDIYCILRDHSGRIWIATRAGVCYYEKGEIKRPAAIASLNEGIVRYLFEDSKHNIWLGCENQGAYRIKADMSAVTHFSTYNVLPDNYVSTIMEGLPGQIWMTSSKGIVAYDDLSGQYALFSLYDGIPGYVFNDGAVQKTDNGTIWWGNEKGLISVRPADMKEVEPTRIRLTRIVVGERAEAETIDKLPAAPEYLKEIRLPSSQKNLIFSFSDLRYDMPPSIIYEYKLEGVHQTWQKTTANHDILIVDVPVGNHILSIRKAGDDVDRTSYAIRKEASYTLYWLVAACLLIGGAFFFSYKSLLLKLKAKISQGNNENIQKSKYSYIKTEESELAHIAVALIEYMKAEKPYLNPNFKLEDMAQAINYSKTKISKTLSQQLDTSFSNFVTQYRIEAFKTKAAEGRLQQLTLTSLAKECGFNSRSAFFQSMKKLTGQTPTEFLKEAGIELDS